MDMSITVWIGIDVSQAKLDVRLLRTTGKAQHKGFGNDAASHAQLLRWVHHLVGQELCHFCLESTGSYSTAGALFLAEAGQRVSLVNPAPIKYAGLAQDVCGLGPRRIGNKTDHAAARLIADYCRKEQPALWQAAAPEVRELVALVRRLHNVQAALVQEQNRMGQPGLSPAVRASLKGSIRFLEKKWRLCTARSKLMWSSSPACERIRRCCCVFPA